MLKNYIAAKLRWQLPIGVDISNQKSDREIIEEFEENAKQKSK